MSGLFKAVGSAISGVTDVVGGLFGGAKPQPDTATVAATLPPAPAVEPPPVMPLPDDKAIQMQQRKSLAALVKTRGRASTILTADGTLGTPPEALGG